jgi:putative sterol carrier protein
MIMSMQEKIAAHVQKLSALKATVGFEFEDGEGIFIDATQNPPAVNNLANQDTDCTISIKKDDFEKMLSGGLDPLLAFTLGKIKVKGSMGIAMKLSSLWE